MNKGNLEAVRHAQFIAKRYLAKNGIAANIFVLDAKGEINPYDLLEHICTVLELEEGAYKNRTRVREYTECRFISSLIMRRFYPSITLSQIGRLFGGLDHTTIISGISRAHDLLDAKDIQFTEKYNKVLKAIDQWIESKK